MSIIIQVMAVKIQALIDPTISAFLPGKVTEKSTDARIELTLEARSVFRCERAFVIEVSVEHYVLFVIEHGKLERRIDAVFIELFSDQ